MQPYDWCKSDKALIGNYEPLGTELTKMTFNGSMFCWEKTEAYDFDQPNFKAVSGHLILG